MTDPTTSIDTSALELSPAGRAALDDISDAVAACVRRMREKRAEEKEERTQKEATARPEKLATAS
jgi:hypothetical protein